MEWQGLACWKPTRSPEKVKNMQSLFAAIKRPSGCLHSASCSPPSFASEFFDLILPRLSVHSCKHLDILVFYEPLFQLSFDFAKHQHLLQCLLGLCVVSWKYLRFFIIYHPSGPRSSPIVQRSELFFVWPLVVLPAPPDVTTEKPVPHLLLQLDLQIYCWS